VVWFKAARPAFAHDARVLQILHPLAPDLVPEVIASTVEGWLLLADAGERAREHPSIRALNWEHVAALGETEHLVDRIRLFLG
jgi:hypothetical protein